MGIMKARTIDSTVASGALTIAKRLEAEATEKVTREE
jgi:hypothetical protein